MQCCNNLLQASFSTLTVRYEMLSISVVGEGGGGTFSKKNCEKKEGLLIELRFAFDVLITASSNYSSQLFINIRVLVVGLVMFSSLRGL